MNKIILQPTSNKDAYEHYVNTILNPVPVEVLKKYIDDDLYKKIMMQYPNGMVYVWGVTNGVNDVNKRKWDKITRGDVTLFSKKGGVFASAVTTLTFHNKELAQELWGTDKNGNTWENIYLVEDVKKISIPYQKLNPILGYRDNNVIQGFTVLNQEQSEKLDAIFDLFSAEISERVAENEYVEYVLKLNDEVSLNVENLSYGRREQSFLRNHLFGTKKSHICGICGRVLPVSMLITAHIKKRSECTKQEKLDYKNIVMPMCKFGCDDLYEKGYIYVRDGYVRVNRNKWITEDLKKEVDSLDGRKCDYYNENTEKYFEAHREKFGLD